MLEGISLYSPIGASSMTLANLIMCLIGLILSYTIIIKDVILKKQEKNLAAQPTFSGSCRIIYRRIPQLVFASVLSGFLAVVLFFNTQVISCSEIVWLDYWSIAHVILLVFGVFSAINAHVKTDGGV